MNVMTQYAASGAHILLPTLFWIRGVWRNNDGDQTLAMAIVGIVGLLRTVTEGGAEAINMTGAVMSGMGIVMLILGTIKRIDKTWKIVAVGLTLNVVGAFLMLLCT